MTPSRPVFVSLETFWADYLHGLTAAIPDRNHSGFVGDQMNELFGELTKHHFGTNVPGPTRCVCTGCRNNTQDRRPSVCETHTGAIRGTLEARSGVPLHVTYAPTPNRECTIVVSVRHAASGRPLRPWAKLAPKVLLLPSTSSLLVQDNRTGVLSEATVESALILTAIAQAEQTPAMLARVCNLDVYAAAALLDEMYKVGWVECRFAPDPTEE